MKSKLQLQCLMEQRTDCFRLLPLLLFLSFSSLSVEGRSTRQLKNILRGREPNSKVVKHLDYLFPPSLEVLGPSSSPQELPPFCVYPPSLPFTPTLPLESPPPPPPASTNPPIIIPNPPEFSLSPPGYIPTPPETFPGTPGIGPGTPIVLPSPTSFQPSPPGFEPIPPSFEPSPPGFEPSPPGFEPSPPGFEPSPPRFEPNPPGFEPSPPGFEPSPPIFEPNPPGFEPSPPGFEPSPPGFEPNPPIFEPSPPGYEPSLPPPEYFPGPPVFIPGPPIFLPPVVYPPPNVPPPPHAITTLGLWCVAKPTVPDPIIQEAMNYACGSGADCDAIQLNGLCYQPDTLIAHASFAFNSYWQRTKVAGGTCDFGGTAMLITRDPSYDGCHFIISGKF